MAKNIAELRQKQHLAAQDFGANDVAAFFAHHEKQIQSVIPEHMNPKRMLRIAVNAINTTPTLAECSVESLVGAVVQSSIMGLEPNTPLGQAYLVPFWNNKKKCKEVQFIPGYRGLIDLARRSGHIESITAHVIYSEDEFEFEFGLDERLVHRPAWNKNRGDMIGAYAIAKFKDGGHAMEILDRAAIEAIRDQSQGYQASQKYNFDSPWTSNFDEMARKTVVRRLAKYLPMSIEMQDAVALDNTANAAAPQELDKVLEGDFHVVDNSANQMQEWEAQIKARGYYEDPQGNFVNKDGEVWNPEVHATSREDQGPVINSDGSFRARRGTAKEAPAEKGPEEGGPENTTQEPGDDSSHSESGENAQPEPEPATNQGEGEPQPANTQGGGEGFNLD